MGEQTEAVARFLATYPGANHVTVDLLGALAILDGLETPMVPGPVMARLRALADALAQTGGTDGA